MEKAILAHKPLTQIERLQMELERAVDEERFEDAARLRDRLRMLERQNHQ